MVDSEHLGAAPLYERSKYAHDLRAELPPTAFEPARSRLLLLPVHLAIIAVATVAVARGWVWWQAAPLLSFVIGISFACMTFVAHEALHGAIVRGKTRQQIVGWIGFLPFMLSPRLWAGWHNRTHHANTNLELDPDEYPTLAQYHEHRGARFAVDMFSLGGRRWRGVLSLVLGFTVQSANQLINARDREFLTAREHRLAYAETGLGVLVWVTVAVLVGFVPFLFVFVLPLLIGNVCVMAFILTNHSLSPRVAINDPLLNGLSVTVPRVIEWMTLGFGYHVEHHIFPAMSSRHARSVRTLVQDRWPERYQSMSLRQALRALHRTARVYKDATTLIDPMTGREYPTLQPRARVAAA